MLGHNKRLERKLEEQGGQRAWATVLEGKKQWASTGGFNVAPGQAGSITIHREFRLRVEPDGEAPFETTVKQVFNDSHGWHIPEEGWSVTVIYDPNDHSKVVMDLDKMPVRPGVDRDEAIARHERATARIKDPAARRQQIEDMRAQAASQVQSASALQEMVAKAASQAQQAAPKADIADQLTKLADLRDRGVLSEAEFDARKAKILAES
jgi:Short C-terminal domain